MASAALPPLRRISAPASAAALALTAWLWLGDWPQETKQLVDHMRSVRTKDFKYIRNFLPYVSHMQPNQYKETAEQFAHQFGRQAMDRGRAQRGRERVEALKLIADLQEEVNSLRQELKQRQ